MEKMLRRVLRKDLETLARKAIRYLSGTNLALDFAYLLSIAENREGLLTINMPPRHLETMTP